MDGNHAAGAGPTLSTIDGVGDIALSIATYLPTARDKLSLLQVNHAWRDVLSAHAHDALLFHNHLKEDFVEGVVLARVAMRHAVSRRRLYVAFRRRWRLPKEGGERVCIPWQRPRAQTNEDVSSLIFIGRVGKDDNPETCALMRWIERDHSPEKNRLGDQKLEIGFLLEEDAPEEDWEALEEEYGGFDVPHNERLIDLLDEEDRDDDWHREFCEEMNKTHGISLHVIDLRGFWAITLIGFSTEETSVDSGEMEATGSHLPELLGTAQDGQIQRLSVRCELSSLYVDIYLREFQKAGWLEFSFGRPANATISQRSDICNYLRTLMKEKCGTRRAP
ncbi:hypothetical protein ACHAXT_011132 [Thalassiosira profunda]